MFNSVLHKLKNYFSSEMPITIDEGSRYYLSGDVDKDFDTAVTIANELIQKIECLYSHDFSSKSADRNFPEEVKEQLKKCTADNLVDGKHHEKLRLVQTGNSLDFTFERVNILTRTLPEAIQMKVLLRVRKSIIKFCRMMANMSQHFDLDNTDPNLTGHIKLLEELTDGLDKFSFPKDYKVEKVTFVDGFVAQGKTSYIEEQGEVSYEFSQYFRIPLVESKQLMTVKFYGLFSLWGFFVGFFNKKEEVILDRCPILQSAFSHENKNLVKISKLFLDNFFNLFHVHVIKFKFFLYYNNMIPSSPADFSWKPTRQLEIQIYAQKDFRVEFQSHVFRKLFLFFFLYPVPYFEIEKLSIPHYRAINLGNGFSIIPTLEIGTVKILMPMQFFFENNRVEYGELSPVPRRWIDCSDRTLTDFSMRGFDRSIPLKQTNIRRFLSTNNGARLLIDDSYNSECYFYYNESSTQITLEFTTVPIILDLSGIKDSRIMNDLPVFDFKNDEQNAKLVGIRSNRSLDDSIDIILSHLPYELAPLSQLSMLSLGIRFNPGHLRDSQWVLRSRYFHSLILRFIGDDMVLENYSKEPVQLANRIFCYMPRFKVDLKVFSDRTDCGNALASVIFTPSSQPVGSSLVFNSSTLFDKTLMKNLFNKYRIEFSSEEPDKRSKRTLRAGI
jgi:hypothetical protein